jgi:archaemetzincin
MNQRPVTILPFGHFEKDFLEEIAEAVRHEFQVPVTIKETHFDLSEFFDPGRRQYDGNKLLKVIDKLSPSDSLKTIGLFSVDLFIPILTYIFGQAYLGGLSGIASIYRLSNERYGIESGGNIVLSRFKKEVIHELGHTFGLIHCRVPTCVMRSSTYVEDIDQKDQSLCNNCRQEINIIKA